METAGIVLPDIRGRIEFKNVSFSYPQRPEAPVLKDMSFTVEPGKTLALVGQSGSGKSTVIALLERLYAPSSGNVLVDGVDVSSFGLNFYRQRVAVVSQEPQLFGTTISNNIQYGVHFEVGAAEIERAATEANAHEFILQCEKGYDTVVGEKGMKLSGGQRQRIAIARFVTRPVDTAFLIISPNTVRCFAAIKSSSCSWMRPRQRLTHITSRLFTRRLIGL